MPTTKSDKDDVNCSLSARRWFRFRLRTLLILTTGVAIILAIFTAQTNTQRVTKEIELLHGRYEIKHGGPDWIREWFGREIGYDSVGPLDCLSSVELGQFGGSTSPPPTEVRNGWLKNLNGQEELRELGLSCTMITDDGIRSLADLPELRVLRMQGLQITDASLQHVSTFARLEELDVGLTEITDHGVAHLVELRNLRRLWLRETQITDCAIDSIRRMSSLEYLDLSSTTVSEKAINDLRLALPDCHVFK